MVVMMAVSLVACSDEGKPLMDVKLSKYVKISDCSNIVVDIPLASLEEYEYDIATEEYFRNICETIGIKGEEVQAGDWVNIDYAGYKDGEQFQGGTASDKFLEIGSGDYIDGFEDGLIGLVSGETIDLNLKFPDDYHSADLAGAEVVFTVTVNYIVPEMADANVKAIGSSDFTNVAELKQYVRETLDQAVADSNRESIISAALSKMSREAEYQEIPDYFIAKEKEYLQAQFGADAADYGLELDNYFLMMYGMKTDDLARQYVKQRFLILAIAQEIDAVVTEEDAQAALETQAELYGMTTEELLASYANDMDFFRESLYAEQVYDYLYENVTVGPEPTEDVSE